MQKYAWELLLSLIIFTNDEVSIEWCPERNNCEDIIRVEAFRLSKGRAVGFVLITPGVHETERPNWHHMSFY